MEYAAATQNTRLVDSIASVFSQAGFMPHNHCYLGKPGLVWTMFLTDTLIGLAYVLIALTLWALIRKIRLPFNLVVFCFGVFILACGLTHFMEVWTLWHPDYWWSALVKIVTAIASVGTGVYLYQLRHTLVSMAEATQSSDQRRIALEELTLELERRIAERTQALQISEAKFRDTFEKAAIGLAHIALDGRWLKVNPRFCEIIGYSEEELLPKTFGDITHPDDLAKDLEQAGALLRGEIDSYSMEKRYFHKSGRIVWVNLTGSMSRKEDGEPDYFIACVDDITREKEILRRLEDSEAEFRSLANAIPQLAWMANAEGWVYWYNDRWYEYTGTTLDEMKGWGWQKVHHPDHVQRVIDFVSTAWKRDESWELTFPLRRHDGERRWFLTRAVPIKDESGRVVRWLGTNTDIHEERTLSEERERLLDRIDFERTRFETAMSAMPLAVMIAEASGKLVFSNPQIQQVWGHPMIPSQSIDEYREWTGFHPDGRPYQPYEWPMARSLLKGETVAGEVCLVPHPDGRMATLQLSSAPIRDPSGRIIAGVVICQDITRLMDAIRARDEFLSIASHELKTPLTTLKLQSQMRQRSLERGDAAAFSLDRIRKIVEGDARQIDRIARLVDDMLDIARINTGKLTLQRESVDLCALANDVVERYSPQIEASECDVSVACLKSAIGNWDRFRIEQVLANLLTNALRYAAGKPVRIRISRKGVNARLEVQDEGIGIARENHERIFERFERAISANEVSGLGLGLHIVRQITEIHGGKVWVESELGKGATFIVELPLGEQDGG